MNPYKKDEKKEEFHVDLTWVMVVMPFVLGLLIWWAWAANGYTFAQGMAVGEEYPVAIRFDNCARSQNPQFRRYETPVQSGVSYRENLGVDGTPLTHDLRVQVRADWVDGVRVNCLGILGAKETIYLPAGSAGAMAICAMAYPDFFACDWMLITVQEGVVSLGPAYQPAGEIDPYSPQEDSPWNSYPAVASLGYEGEPLGVWFTGETMPPTLLSVEFDKLGSGFTFIPLDELGK